MEHVRSAKAPVACSLAAGDFNERLAWIADLNRTGLLGMRHDGHRLTLTYRPDHAERVREMVRRERRCCGFLGFDLREDRDGVTLSIEAPQGAADALAAFMRPSLPTSPRDVGCGGAMASSGGEEAGDDR